MVVGRRSVCRAEHPQVWQESGRGRGVGVVDEVEDEEHADSPERAMEQRLSQQWGQGSETDEKNAVSKPVEQMALTTESVSDAAGTQSRLNGSIT